MVLTVNIGNTNLTIGGYEADGQKFCGCLHSDPLATADEYALLIRELLRGTAARPASARAAFWAAWCPC